LVRDDTRALVELNEDSVAIWRAVTSESSWEGVVTALAADGYASDGAVDAARGFVTWAVEQGWLEEPRELTADADALVMAVQARPGARRP
jgi:hypothetical protein